MRTIIYFSSWIKQAANPYRRLLMLIPCLLLGLFSLPGAAQDQCSSVTSIGFPVDRSAFQIAQDFAVPSPRHQGRYHTGEDYYGGRGSFGVPVHAIAAGRVTFSSPNGWGRDGGVVIIEHTFPDGSLAYSMYGHMREGEGHPFPLRFTCVQAGDIVGVVGDARPAPHLHFEMRSNQPDLPGPGYTTESPESLGWLQPTRFILNWASWLLPAHRWHAELNDDLIAPPLLLPDGSMMALTAERLRGLTPDGRILWRINLEKSPLGLTWWQELPLLTYADGMMQIVNFDGSLGESWTTGSALDSPPILAGDQLLFHTPAHTLVAFAPDRRVLVWQLEGVPAFVSAFAAPNVIALLTANHTLLSLSPDGKLLDQAQLSEGTTLGAAPNGDLLVYTHGGFWQVDSVGSWSLVVENAPPGGEGGAAVFDPAGSHYLLSPNPPGLYAYDSANTPLWQTDLLDVSGRAELRLHNNVLLLTTQHGHLMAWQADRGALCSRVRLYGDNRSISWHSLGEDGLLRFAVGDQIIGLDWKTFLGGCQG